MYTWSLCPVCINECGSGAVYTGRVASSLPTARCAFHASRCPPAHLSLVPDASSSTASLRAFITSKRPTIQVCFPPHNLRCHSLDYGVSIWYTGHSNNKDAKINPSALKKRKLSEAISTWIGVMQRSTYIKNERNSSQQNEFVETEGKC